MEVQLFDTVNKAFVSAIIEKAEPEDMPLKKNGWQFNWKKLFKTESVEIYKLTLIESPLVIQGLIMLTLMNDEMIYMNNIEVAPHNIGKNGKFDHTAACLIAYGCHQSFEKGKGYYVGYLTFESKTELIPLYQKKYEATLAMGQRMFIEPEIGIKLMKKYLRNHDK